MDLLVSPTGVIRCLYAETLPLHEFGALRIARASQVEPDALGRWWADLAPVQGPRLGPFEMRSQALSAEATWLQAHVLRLPAD